jgi:acyl-CoA synthetase (AMP-forming)/AMP-acid ligase II
VATAPLGEAWARKALGSLARVVTAGAPASPPMLRRFGERLAPGTRLYTPYGATEALPIAVIEAREIFAETAAVTARGGGVCVGRAVAETDVAIVRIDDGPIATLTRDARVEDGAIGEIAVSGPQVTTRYHARERDTALTKMHADGPGGALYHRTGDLGYRDAAGRLWFVGRKAHRVAAPSVEHYPLRVEGVFNAHPLVHRSALVGAGEFGRMRPVVLVEPARPLSRRERATLVAELKERARDGATTRDVEDVRCVDAMPVDIRHNAKIKREQLKALVDRGRL